MPITIPNELPAKAQLESEKIFALEDSRAKKQDIRPLKIAILNLMPKKIETETQILRLISKSPLQVSIDFMKVSSHNSKNTSKDHLLKFYANFEELKDNYYDGLIITGAPVEHLPFEEVDYFEELKTIMDWSKSHVFSTMHICWGAQAGLYYHYGVEKMDLDSKMFGIFPCELTDEYAYLTNGFDEVHFVPQSRHTTICEEQIKANESLKVLSYSLDIGSNIIATRDYRHIFVLGHFEYSKDTLANEYFRDLDGGKDIDIPKNYFIENDSKKGVILNWRSHANLLYRNWLAYIYQMTPYKVEKIGEIKEKIGANVKNRTGFFKPFIGGEYDE